jgi:hypothetical protein
MAGELCLKYTTAQTVKALLWGHDRTTRWNGAAMVAASTISDASWATGMVSMTEQLTANSTRTGTYAGAFPAEITTPGEYYIEFYAGSAPTPGQAAIGFQTIEWNGSAQQYLRTAAVLDAAQPNYAPAKAGDAMALTSGERTTLSNALLDLAAAVDGKTLREVMRIMAAILAGKVSGAGSGSESFTGLDGLTPRVEVTTDPAGNRTDVEYDPV